MESKKEWISLGIHQGELTLNNSVRIIKILTKLNIPCYIGTLGMLPPFTWKRTYYVHVKDWATWNRVIHEILPKHKRFDNGI